MGTVTIRCPTTGEEVSTGVVIDADGFALINFQGERFRCDACGEMHLWDKADAIFQPDGAGP